MSAVSTRRFDYLLWVPLTLVSVLYGFHLVVPNLYWALDAMGTAVVELINTMALGIVIGIFMVGAPKLCTARVGHGGAGCREWVARYVAGHGCLFNLLVARRVLPANPKLRPSIEWE